VKERKLFEYSIVSTFVGLITVLFIAIIICISWKIDKLTAKFEQEQLTNLSNNITYNLQHCALLNSLGLDLVQKIIIDNKYSNNQEQINKLLEFVLAKEQSNIKLAKQITWFKNVNPNIQKNNSNNVITLLQPVTDKQNQYYGTIQTDIDIKELKIYIEEAIKNKKISYAIFSLDNLEILLNNFNDKVSLSNSFTSVLNRHQNNIGLKPKHGNDGQDYFAASSIPLLNIGIVLHEERETLSFKKYLNAIKIFKNEIITTIFLVIFLFYIFYKAILDPFLILSNAALAISKGESIEFDKKLIHSKEGLIVAEALEKIKQSVNLEKELVQEISRAHNKLSITNLRLENKVHLRTQELEKALKLKDRFITYLTYELKTPLKGLLRLVKSNFVQKNYTNYENQAEVNQQLMYVLKRLYNMVNDMLDFPDNKTFNNTLKLSYFNLNDLINEIISECKILYLSKKTVTINYNSKEDFKILADRDKLAQVLRNILSSSIERSKNNYFIAIRLKQAEIINKISYLQDQAVNISILDQSEIKNKDYINSLFSEQNIKSDNIPYLISKDIITAHQGNLNISESKDGGIETEIIIPLLQAEYSNEEVDHIASSANRYNILMIDDEESCTTGMEVNLRNSHKYNLIKCNSAQAGLQYLSQNYKNISIILLDLMIPDVYGINVLNEIKENPNYNNIPIILQTGSSDEGEIVKAFNAGITCFIKKPYSKSQILKEIEKALRLYKLNQESEEDFRLAC
jgi:two-component system, sensor histidine kinase ChiS